MTTDGRSAPLIVLGIDAGDADLIEAWSREGHLPRIASLMARGRHGRTSGGELISEHGVWVSLCTGVSRARHGYHYFRELRPGTYDLQRRTGHDLDVRPFWAGLTDRKSLIVDAPDIDLVPGLPGLQLRDWATHSNWDPQSTPSSEPADLLPRVQSRFGEKLLTVENHESTVAHDRSALREVLARVKTKGALCRELLGRQESDLAVIVFGESHVAYHQFWKYHLAEPGDPEFDPHLKHAIRDVYAAIDREIGSLLSAFHANANVVVVSSVGTMDDYPTGGLAESFLRRLGYQATPAGGGGGRSPMDLARRWIPESWRVAVSRRFSRATRERLLAEQFLRSTDWGATSAFAVPSAYTSFVRVNLRGREPSGTISPGPEYDELLNRLVSELNELVDPVDGRPAVTRVVKTVELFGCAPHERLPDLFVDWKPGRFMRRVTHPRAEIVQSKPDFFRRSDHSAIGFVAAAGESIRQDDAPLDVSPVDLAPTFLALLGRSPRPEMSGRVIDALCRPPVAR